MSQKIKILIGLFIVLIAGYFISITIDETIKKEKVSTIYLAKAEVYFELLPNYFNQKIEVENFDHIESIFKEANQVMEKLANYDIEKYNDLVKKFEYLKHKKDKYKAIKSQITMSYLFIQKEISKNLNTNLEIQKILNDAILFGVDSEKLQNIIQNETNMDSAIKNHLILILNNTLILEEILSKK